MNKLSIIKYKVPMYKPQMYMPDSMMYNIRQPIPKYILSESVNPPCTSVFSILLKNVINLF